MKKAELSRDEMLTRMSNAYYELLVHLTPAIRKNADVKTGIREGLGKFLSNVCIALVGKANTDYYSEDACKKLQAGEKSGLEYEHIVPKKIYQDEIADQFMNKKGITVAEIKEILARYWYTATITKSEHSRLSRQSMPEGWDGRDVLARYRKAAIPLMTREEFLALR